MENILLKLKNLKELRPDEIYSRQSKALIFAAPLPQFQPEKSFFWNWRLVLTFAGLLAVLTVGRFNDYFIAAPQMNAQALETELQKMEINIQLAKIEYYQKTEQAISMALREASESQTNHLSPLILESEQTRLKMESPQKQNPAIEQLLNQLLL